MKGSNGFFFNKPKWKIKNLYIFIELYVIHLFYYITMYYYFSIFFKYNRIFFKKLYLFIL